MNSPKSNQSNASPLHTPSGQQPAGHLQTDLLARHLYGELSSGERRAVDKHLQRCAECSERLNRWRDATGVLDAWDQATSAASPKYLWHSPAAGAGWSIALAAAASLLIGLGIGRLTTPAAPDAMSPAEVQQIAESAAAGAVQRQQAVLAQQSIDQQRMFDQQLSNALDLHWRQVGYEEIRKLAGAIASDVWAMAQTIEARNLQIEQQLMGVDRRQYTLDRELKQLWQLVGLEPPHWTDTSLENRRMP